MRSYCFIIATLLIFPAMLATVGNETDTLPQPPVRSPEKLLVFPTTVNISNIRDHQSIVAQLSYDDGITTDVSDAISVNIANEQIVKWSDGRLVPVATGKTVVEFKHSGLSVPVSVNVTDAKQDPAISFRNDIIPILSRVGCNAGSCHGAARGQDGFQLSLYGFDPEGDYFRIARELPGRRIDLALPEDCLLIAKATGDVSHTGGAMIKPNSDFHQRMLRWLKEGAINDSKSVQAVERIELHPQHAVLNGNGARQQMSVVAHYADGTDRDVTDLSYFLSNNDNSARVDADGTVIAHNRGEAFITARFDTHTVGTPFIVLPHDQPFIWNDEPEVNYVDTKINEKLKKLRMLPSDLCSDSEFIRRVSIDICGIAPTAQEVLDFEDDPTSNKRTALVDALLKRDEFVDIWVMKWSELLQVRSLKNRVSYKAALLYSDWLQGMIADEVPVDQMIRKLLSSEGTSFTTPAINYYLNEPDKLKIAENVAQVFMGIRIQCAQCHNHPFDRWSMDDYYSFAAFFTRVAHKSAADPREKVVFNRNTGESKHPVSGANVPPKFLGGAAPDTSGKDRRAVLAQWLASEDNPYFANNLANIIWAHFFGRGIIDEVDDVRISNPAVNQELLDELGKKLIDYKYDFKSLVRDICNSRTYQRSTATNTTNSADISNFSHSSLRRIRAEVLLDVISEITETENKFRGLPLGSRAVQIADGNVSTYFLSTFGRTNRETVCSCEVKAEPNLSQALHLINGDTVNKKIRQGKLINRLVKEGLTDEQIINEIYLRCLARKATDQELQQLIAEVEQQKKRIAALEDIFWAVLNSREFVFNH